MLPSPLIGASLATALVLAPLAAQQGDPRTRPRLDATRVSGEVTLDGRLDEADWRRAPMTAPFVQVEPVQGGPVSLGTEVRVLFDQDNLYVGFTCHDSAGPAGIRVQDLRRKFDYFENDLVGVSLDPFLDGRNAVAFQVTPYGTQRDLQVYDGDNYNRQWEGVWRVRTTISDSGWTAELAIPWSTMRYRADGGPWGVNFHRIVRRTNEYSGWVAWPRNLNPYRMDYAGTLEGLTPPPPSADVRVRPYALLDGRREGPGGGAREELRPEVGGEVIWSPTSSSQLELTLNTDFAQADVDRQVVNLSRFSVFFPERRRFFLESATLFTAGLESEYVLQPFFSRRIGLGAGGQPIPIQGGLRGVRRTARSELGALLIRQDGANGQGPSSFGVARASRNVGGSSRIGVLVTGRLDEAGDARGETRSGVVGADWFTRLGPEVTFNGQVSRSTSSTPGGEGTGGYFFLGRQTNTLYTGLIGALATQGYDPSTGFVSRNNVLLASPAVIADWRPAWRPNWVRSLSPALVSFLYLGASDLVLQEGYIQAYVDVVPNSGGIFYPFVERWFQRPTAAFDLLPGVTVPAGTQDYWRYGVRLQTNQSARAGVDVTASTGGFFDGGSEALSATARLAPSPRVAFEVTYDVNRLRDIGLQGRDLVTHLVAPELRLALNPRVQLSAFWQYNSEREQGTWNARFAWEFAPLSYVYLVYNDQRSIAASTPRPANLPRQQLVMKLVYLHQF